MNFRQLFNSVLRAIALDLASLSAIVLVFTGAIAPTWAAGNQSNQAINQIGVLVAPEPDAKIDVYAKPGAKTSRIGYGVAGDRVTVVEQVGSNEGYRWDYVQFDRSPSLEGWLRADFVAVQSVNDRASSGSPASKGQMSNSQNLQKPYSSGNRDLGRQQQSNQRQYQSNQQQGYRQQ